MKQITKTTSSKWQKESVKPSLELI